MTKIVVFGAGGRAGRAVLAEAGRRRIETTAVVRDVAKYPDIVGCVAGDATDAGGVERVARGHDVAIVAVYAAEQDPAAYRAATERLLEGLAAAGVPRLLIVGLATTLPAENGRRFFEESQFPAEWRPFSQGRADELQALVRHAGPIDWVVLTPPMELVEQADSGRYQLRSLGGPLSYSGLAGALLDEAAEPRHHRAQIGISGM